MAVIRRLRSEQFKCLQVLIIFAFLQGCLLNEVQINEQIFPNFACWKCYENYKSTDRLVKVNCKINHENETSAVPGFIVGEACVPFDHRSESIRRLVQSSISNVTFEWWRKCCNDAIECCESMITNYQAENFFNSCDHHWDGSRCFAVTLPDTTASKNCPYDKTRWENSKCDRKLIESYSKPPECDPKVTRRPSKYFQV